MLVQNPRAVYSHMVKEPAHAGYHFQALADPGSVQQGKSHPHSADGHS